MQEFDFEVLDQRLEMCALDMSAAAADASLLDCCTLKSTCEVEPSQADVAAYASSNGYC